MDFDSNAVDLESLEGGHRLGRRSFLIGALATRAAASAPLNYAAKARARSIPLAKNGSFKLGVSSGFPRPRGITLWTRLGDVNRTSRLEVTVAKDRKFANVVKGSGTPNKEKVGSVTRKHLEEIAKIKIKDMNAGSMEAAIKAIEGTARNMGIKVEG